MNLELSTKSMEYIKKGESFAYDFLDRINSYSKEDYVISPLSMQFLLGLLLDGAADGTADEISKVLGYGAGETEEVNKYCLEMLSQLPKLDKKTTVTIANALMVNKQYPLLDSYIKSVQNYYEAEVNNLDFSDSEAAARKINKWCADHTNDMIKKIIDAEDVGPDLVTVLLNALYFKGEWTEKFSKEYTEKEDFTTTSGNTVKVDMMKVLREYRYGESDTFESVTLPYGNEAYSMTVILPKDGKMISDVTAALKTKGFYQSLYGGGTTKLDVDLWLPKFETKFHVDLNDILSAMGMPSAFGGRADFSAMSKYALCLSFVRQDAAIRVDESGSEAAAISSAGMKLTALPEMKTVTFHADRPFLYLIMENSTGTVLFAGRFGAGS